MISQLSGERIIELICDVGRTDSLGKHKVKYLCDVICKINTRYIKGLAVKKQKKKRKHKIKKGETQRP